MQTQVILVGIGGGSSAGKTTLVRQLSAVIPDCVVLRQDDFWTPLQDIPIHPIHNLPDIEDPETTIKWSAFREALKRFRSNQPFDDSHPKSRETCSPSSKFDGRLPASLLREWANRFKRFQQEQMQRGVKVEWRLVEGFVLYYDKEVMNSLDLCIFLRSPGYVLQKRRQGRQYVHDDGTVWTNPPKHWNLISYPAYIRAHAHLFRAGDVEKGSPLEPHKLLLIEGEGTEQNLSFEDFFTVAATAILQVS